MAGSADDETPPLEDEKIALGMNEPTFAFLERAAVRHERMFRVESLLGESQIVLRHPQEARHVLASNARNYTKGRATRNMRLLMGNGLIVQDGDLWRRQRKLMQPLFHRHGHAQALAHALKVMEDGAERLATAWAERAAASEPINVTQDVSRATLRVVLEALFGEDLPRMADRDGRNPFELLTDETARSYQMVPRFRELLQHIVRVVERRLAERRAPPDMLSLIMAARGPDGEPMAPGQIVDELATLIVAGHETTASVLSWLWYLAAVHPGVQDRLADEGFARLALDETMRLYPPGWIVDRQAVADDAIGGRRIQAGTEVLLSIYHLQRDPRFFAQPGAFRPERFADFRPDPGHPIFIPFGMGPRRCIGEEFALLHARRHVAVIARRLRLRAPADGLRQGEVEVEARVNLRPRRDFILLPELVA